MRGELPIRPVHHRPHPLRGHLQVPAVGLLQGRGEPAAELVVRVAHEQRTDRPTNVAIHPGRLGEVKGASTAGMVRSFATRQGGQVHCNRFHGPGLVVEDPPVPLAVFAAAVPRVLDNPRTLLKLVRSGQGQPLESQPHRPVADGGKKPQAELLFLEQIATVAQHRSEGIRPHHQPSHPQSCGYPPRAHEEPGPLAIQRRHGHGLRHVIEHGIGDPIRRRGPSRLRPKPHHRRHGDVHHSGIDQEVQGELETPHQEGPDAGGSDAGGATAVEQAEGRRGEADAAEDCGEEPGCCCEQDHEAHQQQHPHQKQPLLHGLKQLPPLLQVGDVPGALRNTQHVEAAEADENRGPEVPPVAQG
mmetsp:Transcript_38765/g.101320  ORF Transcript_38765/g.101320 Transcript_38765/m.101320 type:complete len:358 (-) Transcript_38765:2409-3482(-)